MPASPVDIYRQDLVAGAKSGVDFMCAATLLWLAIALIWRMEYSEYDKSVFTFIVGAVMLPLAWLFSRLIGTDWKMPDNPLSPLGLWLNFAQLFYFPFLIYFLSRSPEHFVMGYAIITGAHLFPYAWFYREPGYAVAAGVISVGALFGGLYTTPDTRYIIPLFTAGCFLAIVGWLFARRSRWRPDLRLQP